MDPDFDEPHLDPEELNDLGGTLEDIQYLIDADKGIVGLHKPRVVHIWEPHDKHSYRRFKVAQQFGVSEFDLPEEPDHLRTDDQGWS